MSGAADLNAGEGAMLAGMSGESNLLNEERRRAILAMVRRDGRVLVNTIAERFGVSPVTARNDLLALHKRGLVQRVHGGAISIGFTAADPALRQKAALHGREKAAIAQAAAKLVQAGETIVLDSGSTTMEIAKQLRKIAPLTVVTNAVNIAETLAGSEVEVVLTGGTLRENSFSLVGPLAEETLAQLNADRLFLGVDGIDTLRGVTTPNLLEAKVNRVMISIAREVVVVSDSSKFGRRSLCHIAPLRALHRLITDRGIPPADLKRLREAGVEVTLV